MTRGRRTLQTGRSAPEQYAHVPYTFLQSVAWRSLGGAAVKVYWELRSRFWGTNNGQIVLSYEDASRTLGLGKATVHRAFRELQEKGYIKLVKRGHWYGRKANEWAVTDKPCQGHLPTNDWNKWVPKAQKTKVGSNAEGVRL